MKKVLSVLLALAMVTGIGVCGAVTASAATDITAKFTDPAFRAAVYEHIGKTAPAPILDTDVAGIKELKISGKGIQSLAGLGDFTSLIWLLCDDNQLVSLPALPPSLATIDCSSNELTSLPALPPNLGYLNCNQNQLTVLPALPNGLEGLFCGDNRLTSLPALPATLTRLHCYINQLTSLNVTGLQLLQLMCFYNLLPDKSAVIGFTGVWDEVDFRFGTQYPLTDKTALNALIAQAKAITKGNYTDASWNALQTAIATAQSFADYLGSDQATVDAQVTALQNAMNGLRENAPSTPANTIPGTSYEATIINWILYIVFFGWLWMR